MKTQFQFTISDQCCGVGGGGASTGPQPPQLQGTNTRTTIMQDPVLETILEQMREAEARRAELERQHAETQAQLRDKLAGRYPGPESVEALQSKIRELEKKTELQMVRHEELSLELTSLRRARSRGPVASNVTSSTIPLSTWPPVGSEIDRIIAKIEQDNSLSKTSAGRILHELDHSRSNVTTQQPSGSQNVLRSSSENLPSLGQHQHPQHPHALNLGLPSQAPHYAGSPMPLTPMMPGCPPLTPNGPPYHYSEPIPPAPSLSTSQSQPAFQQKLQQYQQQQQQQQQQHQQQHELSSSHSQGTLPSQQKQQQTHTHFSGNQYQESYPHTQTYQQPMQQQQQQHPVSTSYLASGTGGQNVMPHYTQPSQTNQNFHPNGNQQTTTYPSLSMASHPNGTYNAVATSYASQLSHHNYSGPHTSIPQTTLSSLPPYSTTTPAYHTTLNTLTSSSQNMLPFSTGQSTFSTTGTNFSTVGTNAYGTSGVNTGATSGGLLQAIGDPLQAMQQLSAQSQASQLQQQAIIHQIQQSLRASSPTATGSTGHHFLGPRQMPKIPTGILSNPLDRLTNENVVTEGQVDMLDIPGKGRCYVYIARFSYEPFQHSPNENPEAELPVQGGDYLLVWGQPDDDGFLDAETLDGRRGLVPANFVQKLVGDDLLEFHQAVLGLRDVDDAASTNIPQCYLQDIDLELAALEEGNRNRQAELSAYAELDNIADEDEQEPPVPAPQHLTLERQLNKSVLIGWTAPQENSHHLESYHVYVDGVLKVTVKATERTRALVEGVDSTRAHRISVRSVTHSRRTSRDAACTMVIGKDVAMGPTAVKASNVTATSAVISWLPSNSNHQHVVCVNNVEVRTVKPGVYRHTITGLAPSTIYRVTVKAKNLRATHFEDQNTQSANALACHVHFKTLPKGLPDPPVDIQVEAGPQDGTLLVTWQPVALNGSAVTGYAVYADGKKVTDVDSPTGDHALIDIHKLMGLNPKHVTVRTKSRESQSGDSCATAIPCSVLRGGPHLHGSHGPDINQQQQQQIQNQEDPNRRIGNMNQRYPSAPVPAHMRRHGPTRVDGHGQVVIETDENLSDKEIYPGQSISQIGVPEITKDSASEANYSEEEDPSRRGRNMPPHHAHHRYNNPGMPAGPTHRGGRPAGGPRPQDPYYDQPVGNQRGRGPMYRVSRGAGQAQGGVAGGPHHAPGAAQQINKRTRWFVALFDYDPTTMSPNPDACEEELPFNEGDTIKVYGEKDGDGFYWGECRGRRGFVPHNMVEEIKDQGSNQGVANRRGGQGAGQSDRWGDIYASMPVKKMIALYDYDPQELSPNVDAEQVELSFQTGNEIYVYGEMDDDGFYMGELDGVRGLVPSNFLTEAPVQGQGQQPQGNRRNPGQGQGPGARGPPPPPREPPLPGHRRPKDASACIVPVSVPVCHLDSRQQQQPLMNNQQQQQQPLMNNQQQQLQQQQQQQQQNNPPPHLAYQQANNHSYTTVTTSNQHGPNHPPPGGVMGSHNAHQVGQGSVPPHLQQQGRGRGVGNRVVGNNPGGILQGPPPHLQQNEYPTQQQQQQQQQQGQQQGPSQQYSQQNQPNQGYNQQNQGYQQQNQQGYNQQNQNFNPQNKQFPQSNQGYGGQQNQGYGQQNQQYSQQNQGSSISGPQGANKPMRGIPAVIPNAQSKTQADAQAQQPAPAAGPNLMQKFTEMAGASAGGDILSKGKELIFMKFGLGK